MASDDLFKSAWSNDVEALRRALAAGADPNAQHPRAGTLPLQLACQGDAIDAIKLLLASGACADATFTRVSRVDGRTFAHHTPLMYAQSVAAAQWLLDAGANLEAADERGWTALVYAAFAGNRALTAFLLDRGADLNVRPSRFGQRQPLQEFMAAIATPDADTVQTDEGVSRLAALSAVRDLICERAGRKSQR